MAEKEPTARKPRRSKEPRGGRFTQVPEPLPWNDENARLLFDAIDKSQHIPPAELMAKIAADLERAANEYLASTEHAGEISSRYWAGKVLGAVSYWRKFAGATEGEGPAWRELAAYELGEAQMATHIYAALCSEQRQTARRGIAGKREKAAADMADLRAAMARVPPAERGSATRYRKALERMGWKSPWSERVTEKNIREILRDDASKTRDSVHVPGGKV